ncbi:HlyC/CorC family transporter [Clostridium sp. D2Q-11]|uniref:HlyC/CorC family transporter n=1 Tax=Anaeromonas frigoriresistens TaxID=2683708 RepID=A0A942UX12_9FIRM|nr:hemolysin family protein [Anaeromonas frigoriresistens]MBS4538369.1 HlyC/CorC family transporter [Anaeromonas frigoriresistens]
MESQKLVIDLGLILILVLLNGFFAASEFALVSVNRDKLKSKREEGNKKAVLLLDLTENPSRFLATIQVGITLAGFLASASAAVTISRPFAEVLEATGIPFIAGFAQQIAVVIGTVILSFITLVLGELVPKRLALEYTDKVALIAVKPITFLAKIMKPVVFILTKSTDIVARLLGSKTENAEEKITESEIRNMINKGKRHGVLNETETQMLQRIFEFDDKESKDIMTSKNKMFRLDIEIPVEELTDKIIKRQLSRVPIYEKDKDEIIGILYIKDLFSEMEDKSKEEINIRKLLRDPYFIPETKKIDVLYKELKASQNHMAIIIDEYGKISGLVTMEDILEEIVGEIFDEFEEKVESIKELEENVYIVDGLESVKKINQELEIDIPLDVSDTIGGFVLSLIDDIPTKGQNPMVTYEDIIFKVEKVENKRIKILKITIK